MRKDSVVTEVEFMFHEKNEDLFAFFPNEIFAQDPIMCSSYSHIGQHSACAREYKKESRYATKEEYAELCTELENLGYNFKILNP